LDAWLAVAVGNVDAVAVAHAAAVALTFAFKLHETSRALYLSSFQEFTVAALKEYEVRMLNDLAFQLPPPQLTPTAFVQELLALVPRPSSPSSSSCLSSSPTPLSSSPPSSSSSSSSSSTASAKRTAKATATEDPNGHLFRCADEYIAAFSLGTFRPHVVDLFKIPHRDH